MSFVKILFIALLTAILLVSCEEDMGNDDISSPEITAVNDTIVNNTDSDDVHTEPDVTVSLTDTTVSESESAGESVEIITDLATSALSWNEICTIEKRSNTGSWIDSWIWARDYINKTYPGRDYVKDDFVYSGGGLSGALSDEYDVVCTLWKVDEKKSGNTLRIITAEFVHGNNRRPATVFEISEEWNSFGLRELYAQLNKDARFGIFEYLEPIVKNGAVAVNLSDIMQGISKAFPKAQGVEFINEVILNDSGYTLLFSADGVSPGIGADVNSEGKLISVHKNVPDIAITEESKISRDGWSLHKSPEGELKLVNLHDGREIIVAEQHGGEGKQISEYRIPEFWRFDSNGRMLYNVYGWEWYAGLGICDPETSSNIVIPCHEPIHNSGEAIITSSRYDDTDGFVLWKLEYNNEVWAEQQILLPDAVTKYDYPKDFELYVEGSRLAVLSNTDESTTSLTLMKFSEDGLKAIVTQTYELDARLTSPQYLYYSGGVFIIGCERYSMCDEYTYIVPIT